MKQKCTKCENTYSYPSKLKQHFNQVHLKIGRNQYGKQNNLYKINVENYFVWTFWTKLQRIRKSLIYFLWPMFVLQSEKGDAKVSHAKRARGSDIQMWPVHRMYCQNQKRIEESYPFKAPKSRTKSKPFTLHRGRVHIYDCCRHWYEKTHKRETRR